MNCAAMKKANAPAVWWQGNDGFLFSDGTRLIATDLDLFNPERKWAPTVDLEELCEALDWLFITHGHEDHYNTATVEYLFKNGPFCHSAKLCGESICDRRPGRAFAVRIAARQLSGGRNFRFVYSCGTWTHWRHGIQRGVHA